MFEIKIPHIALEYYSELLEKGYFSVCNDDFFYKFVRRSLLFWRITESSGRKVTRVACDARPQKYASNTILTDFVWIGFFVHFYDRSDFGPFYDTISAVNWLSTFLCLFPFLHWTFILLNSNRSPIYRKYSKILHQSQIT